MALEPGMITIELNGKILKDVEPIDPKEIRKDTRIWTLFICRTHSMFVEGDQRKSRCHNCMEAILVSRNFEAEDRGDGKSS